MKNASIFSSRFLALLGGLTVVGAAQAGTYTFKPTPEDLDDLDHYDYVSWGINFTVPTNEVITEATLTIKNIYDWEAEAGDILYINLLNQPELGVKKFPDDQGGGNAWANAGPLVGTWTDPAGGSPTGFDLVFKMSEVGLLNTFKNFVADGRVGFGFDPDCHYYNDGVKLVVNTAAVPEPATLAGLGIGIAAWIRKRRKSA